MAPYSLFGSLSALAAAAVVGGGEVRVARSRCVGDMAAGLRLLGYRVDRVSGEAVVVRDEGGVGRGGVFSLRGPCLHPLAFLAPLAAVRLAPGARLVFRVSAPSRLWRWLVEAVGLLGGRAWPLEGGGVVVEAGAGRRLVAGRLYTGWLGLAAGLVYAAVYAEARLAVSLVASGLAGYRWLRGSLAMLGIEAGDVLRGLRLVYEPGAGPRGGGFEPWRSGGAALMALLPLARHGGSVELRGLAEGDAGLFVEAAGAAGLRAGLVGGCGGRGCVVGVGAGGGVPGQVPARVLAEEPDYLYPAAAGLALGGSLEAPYLCVEDPAVAGDRVEAGRVTGAGCGGEPSSLLACAASYGGYAYGSSPPPRGLGALDDRLPGFLALAEEAGCLA